MGVLDSFSLAGKVALLTGGSRGLGRAMAQALAEAGAQVALTARSAADAAAAADELTRLGLSALGVPLEVTDLASVDTAVETVCTALGVPDILVNNAGIGYEHTALAADQSDWTAIMATNVDGVWNCSRAVARRMIGHGGGAIVNIGSMSGYIVNRPRWQPAYLTSKAAVHQLTKALAAEWAPHHIRVNAIAPGYFLTEQSPVDQPEFKPYCVDPAAMQRFGYPAELGPVAVFLASDAASFMTGSVVVVDGGFTLF